MDKIDSIGRREKMHITHVGYTYFAYMTLFYTHTSIPIVLQFNQFKFVLSIKFIDHAVPLGVRIMVVDWLGRGESRSNRRRMPAF